MAEIFRYPPSKAPGGIQRWLGGSRLPLHPHWNKAEHFKPPTRRSVAPLSRSPLKAGQPRCRDQGEGDNVKGWSQPPNHSSNKCTPGHTPGHARQSRTSESASSSPSQAVPKNLPQPKCMSQKLPKKGRKTITGDTELGLFLLFVFFLFSPQTKEIRRSAFPPTGEKFAEAMPGIQIYFWNDFNGILKGCCNLEVLSSFSQLNQSKVKHCLLERSWLP